MERARPAARWGWRRAPLLAASVVLLVVTIANIGYLSGLVDADPAAQLSGLATTTTASVLPGDDNIDPNIGYTAQSYGHLASQDLLHGRMPWWNPYAGLGQPLAGEMQGAVLFPLTLVDRYGGGQAWFRWVLEVTAGLSTLALLRRLGCGWVPSTVGGCLFGLNGTFSWLFHAPGNPIAFLPLVLLGVEQAVAGSGATGARRARGTPTIAVAVALSLYAGFPEVAFIDGLLAGAWAVVRVATTGGGRRGALVRIVVGVGAGVGLAAPILVAFADYLPHAYVGSHGNLDAQASIPAGLVLPALALPYVFGPIFGFVNSDPRGLLLDWWGNIGGYLTSGTVAAALVGLAGAVGGRLRALRIVLAAWVALCITRCVGVEASLRIVNAVPGLSSTAFYRYFWPSTELAAIVLAALGVDDLLRSDPVRAARRVPPRVAAVVAGAVLAVLAAAAVEGARPVVGRLVGAPHHGAWAWSSVGWGLGIAASVLLAAVGPRRARAGVLAGVMVLDAVALFAVPQLSAPRRATIDTAAVAWLQAHVGLGRVATLGPLAPDYGSYYGVAEIDLNDLPSPEAYDRYVTSHLDPNAEAGDFTGSSSLSASGESPAQALVDHLGAYEAVGVRYVLVPAGEPPLSDGAKTLPAVYRDPLLAILATPGAAPYFEAPGCAVRSGATRTAVTVRCARASVLVRDELWMPGWSATVDGRAAPVGAHAALVQQVAVPAGVSTVDFAFTPPHEGVGEVVALLCAIALVAVGVAGRAERRRRPPGRHAIPRSRHAPPRTGDGSIPPSPPAQP